MKVKVIKLDERYADRACEEEKQSVGQVFEAFKICNKYEEDEKYRDQYALNIGFGVWFLPVDCCEVVEDEKINAENSQEPQHPNYPKGILLVEDGSADVDYIEDELDIRCIVYRSGSTPPMWLR